MSFLFDKLFQKQNPELASQMAKRGLVFDKRKHRWVRGVQPDADVTGGEFSGIPGMEGPFRYKTGNTYYYSPKEGKYYDRGQDVFMPRGFDPHTGQYHQDIEEARREKEKKSAPFPMARKILHELGGSKFRAMVGTKDIVQTDNGVQFGIGKGAKQGINKVRISYTGVDTYNMEFFKIRGANVKSIREASNIYSEDLARIFKDTTGLDTKL